MRSERVVLGSCLVSTGLLVGRWILVWHRLPLNLETHWGPTGADGYTGRAAFFAASAAMTLAAIVALHFAPRWLPRVPLTLLNVPHLEYWLATPARVASVNQRLAVWLSWFALPITLTMAVLTEYVLRVNLGMATGDQIARYLMLGIYPSFLLTWIIALQVRFKPPLCPQS
jgi:hypothetical protein